MMCTAREMRAICWSVATVPLENMTVSLEKLPKLCVSYCTCPLPVHPTSLLCLHACTAGIGCIIDGIVYKEGEIVPAGDRCNNW